MILIIFTLILATVMVDVMAMLINWVMTILMVMAMAITTAVSMVKVMPMLMVQSTLLVMARTMVGGIGMAVLKALANISSMFQSKRDI